MRLNNLKKLKLSIVHVSMHACMDNNMSYHTHTCTLANIDIYRETQYIIIDAVLDPKIEKEIT